MMQTHYAPSCVEHRVDIDGGGAGEDDEDD